MATFGDRFKELRIKQGKTQNELANDFNAKFHYNYGKSAISQYENNKRIPEMTALQSWANYFNVTTDYLLGREKEMSDLPPLTKKEERDIAKDLEDILEGINSSDSLSFYGEPMDEETKELMKISLENSMKMAKQIAKQKFTPKKYRKE